MVTVKPGVLPLGYILSSEIEARFITLLLERALLCHTMSEQSSQFYLKQGFLESELDSTTLLYPLTRLLRMIV